MSNLVQAEAHAILEASSGKTTYTNPTTPIKIRLTTTSPTATAAGTEVTNSGGSTYSSQTITFASAASNAIASNVALTYNNMPAATIVGVDEYDSAGTPIRRWFGNLTSSKTTNLGDTLTIGSGSYTKNLS